MENSSFILIAGAIVSLVVLSSLMLLGFARTISILENLLMKAQSDKIFSSKLDTQFNRLDPTTQHRLQTLVNLADPLVQFTATDLDDKTILWLKQIVDGKPNS